MAGQGHKPPHHALNGYQGRLLEQVRSMWLPTGAAVAAGAVAAAVTAAVAAAALAARAKHPGKLDALNSSSIGGSISDDSDGSAPWVALLAVLGFTSAVGAVRFGVGWEEDGGAFTREEAADRALAPLWPIGLAGAASALVSGGVTGAWVAAGTGTATGAGGALAALSGNGTLGPRLWSAAPAFGAHSAAALATLGAGVIGTAAVAAHVAFQASKHGGLLHA